MSIINAAKVVLVLIGAVFMLSSCKALGKDGLILMTDDTYHATVYATNKAGFGAPDGLLWSNGKLYLADEGASSLEVWSEQDGLKKLMTSDFGTKSPEDLVMDAQGNIFFSDDDAGGIWEVDSTGKQWRLNSQDHMLSSTEGIALAPDGSLLVGNSDDHSIYKVTREGAVSLFLGKESGIIKPESMTFDGQGNLYIADNEQNVLFMLDPDHQLHRVIDRQDHFSPETIFYSRGSLYITDSQSSKLYIYTPNNELKAIATFGGKLKNIQGVTVDERGDIYVSIQSDLKHNVGFIVKLSKES
ncbi:MAG TPA: NHL repeat-containing protein [Pyrinomonadaceae bacterium]|nr:NHL repeat-containing protein [Pyrinomonadaceae bacterium]